MAISKKVASEPATETLPPPPQKPDKVARLKVVGPGPHDQGVRPPDLNALDHAFDGLTIRFEADQRSLWCSFNHRERPCFTPALLEQIKIFQDRLKEYFGERQPDDATLPRTLIWGSTFPACWNLGGDLALFAALIRARDEDELRRYAYACIQVIYQNLMKFDLPLLTIALVQGDALGGGFEAALTNDVIIAERNTKFGLPEVLFNLFPGMGAYSLLCRRLDGARAQQMILSGRLYEAEELLEMGVIDLVVDPGEGAAAVRHYLDRNQRRHRVLRMLGKIRTRCQPTSYEELLDVTDFWVDTALALDEADLRRIDHLARAQQRRHNRGLAAQLN